MSPVSFFCCLSIISGLAALALDARRRKAQALPCPASAQPSGPSASIPRSAPASQAEPEQQGEPM